MIKCKICQREFTKLITNTHLKCHNISLDEYRHMFGDNSHIDATYRLEKMKPMKEETKLKISIGVRAYADGHQHEMSLRAQKAIQTKIKNGYDLAFFSGKQHSDKSKKRIALSKIKK